MFMFNKCRDSGWDLKSFWNSDKPELTDCLRYYGTDVLPMLLFMFIFLIDFVVNKSISKQNRLADYFLKTHCLRSVVQIVLIGTSLFELIQSFGIFYKPLLNDPEHFQLLLLASILKFSVYSILLLLDTLHYLKNIGVSSLSSLVVSIDWIAKTYLLFEIAYLHRTSYPNYELVLIAIQATCVTWLLISYVFLANPPLIQQKDQSCETDLLINSRSNKKNANHDPKLDQNDKFSMHKRSLLSQIMFFYFEEYVLFGFRQKYTVDNIIPLEQDLKVDSVLNDYEENYKNKYLKDTKTNGYNIVHLTLFLYKFFWAFNFMLFVTQILLSQLEPQIIKLLITYVKLKNETKWHGLAFTFGLFACTLSRVTIVNIINRNLNFLQAKLQVILVNHIYKKALRRSTLKDDQSFDYYNLMTLDVGNVITACFFSFDIINIPFNTVLSIYFIYNEIGVSIFYALLVFIIIGPLTYFITNITKTARKRTMKAKDSRLKYLSDLINGIKTIKLNYFNTIFERKITEIREGEVKDFKKYEILFGFTQIIFYSLPVLLTVVSFFIYLKIDPTNILTPERAFTAINYFNLLKGSLAIIPRSLHFIVVSFVSGKRIQNFLRSNEKDEYITREFDQENAVRIGKNLNFSWEQDNSKASSETVLKNLNVKIKKNNLVALVAKTPAAGRSSFISCLLGETKLVQNTQNTDPQMINISSDMRIAFVGSRPWIEKKSIKENILFGLPFNQTKYDLVLDHCLIREELTNYPHADDQIMDQDFSLELRQKICLARAYYSDANLILMDDFLKVFNDYLAKIMFDRTINRNEDGLFKDKTCIMVLNRMEYVRYFDQVLMFSDGVVTNQDNLEQEKQSSDLVYKRSISSKLYSYENSDLPVERSGYHDKKNCSNCSKKLIDDDKEVSNLGWPVQKLYFSTWNYCLLILIIVGYFVSMVFQIVQANWLSYWSTNSNNRTGDALNEYNQDGLTKYVIFSLLITIFFAIGNFAAIFGQMISAINFHKILLSKVLRLPLYFFAKTPTGSIINRFSRDIDCVDHFIPFVFKTILILAFQILSVFWVITFTFPMAIIVIFVMMVIYIYLFRVFLKTVIAAKRLELQTITVLYNRFEELSSGLQTILAYDRSKQFTKKLNSNLESNVRCSYMLYIAFKWLDLRNQMIGIVLLIATSLFAILNSDLINGGQAALVLVFAIQLSGMLMSLMTLIADFCINFVSVDRIQQYLDLEEEEDDHQNSNPSENWPSNGEIEFENYTSTYSECLKPSLSNLNFKIDKHSLIAVVGGAGSGKSTLALSLLNAVKRVKGQIRVDNIDVNKIGLKSLRTSVAFFPQDSSLFTGSIRFNLDPENQFTDHELWTVLDNVGLKDTILYLQGNLNYEIDGLNSALSPGQRQLLCLARMFLKNSKLMIIDETDCQFDLDTEARLRKLLRTQFKDRTILLITKNIEHIQAADKVLFMQDGQIHTYNTPEEIFGGKTDQGTGIDLLDVLNNNNSDILDVINNNE